MTGEPTAPGRRITAFMDTETDDPVSIDLTPQERSHLRRMFPRTSPGECFVVSAWSLHVALYALQKGTPEAIERALALLGRDSDVESDESTMPLLVEAPDGWDQP